MLWELNRYDGAVESSARHSQEFPHRWIAIRTDLLGGIFSCAVATYLVYGNHDIPAGDIGFALNQILAFSSTLLTLVRQVSHLVLIS